MITHQVSDLHGSMPVERRCYSSDRYDTMEITLHTVAYLDSWWKSVVTIHGHIVEICVSHVADYAERCSCECITDLIIPTSVQINPSFLN